MLKDLNKGNWIIPPWDRRYGKLGHIFNNFEFNDNGVTSGKDFIKYLGAGCIYYYIPPQLILFNYDKYGHYTNNIKDPRLSDMNLMTNWCSTRFIRRILDMICNLSVQDYFDLMALHINNVSDRPRCPYCHDNLRFSERILSGYGSGGHYWLDSISQFCSVSCATNFRNSDEGSAYLNYKLYLQNGGSFGIQHNNPDKYNAVGFRDVYTRYLTIRNAFINRGDINDICYFFIASTDDGYLKYGITECPELRKSYNMTYNGLINFKVIYSDTRLHIANLKYNIDLELELEENYIKFSDTSKFRNIFNKLISSPDQLD